MRLVAAAVGLVALAVVAVGWLQNPDHITAAEARAAAESAYEAAGLRGAVVDPDPVAGVYVAVEGGERIAVWNTSATLDDGTVELWLSQGDGESVFLDDRAPDGGSQLLTDAQFRQLADHYENPAVGRQIRRNLVLTLAAALVALLALRLSLLARRQPVAAAALVSRSGLEGEPIGEPSSSTAPCLNPQRGAGATYPRTLLRRVLPVARRRAVAAVPVGRSALGRLSRFARRRPAAVPARLGVLRRLSPDARRRPATAVPVPRPAFRAPPRPGRPLRARQETS